MSKFDFRANLDIFSSLVPNRVGTIAIVLISASQTYVDFKLSTKSSLFDDEIVVILDAISELTVSYGRVSDIKTIARLRLTV